MSKTDTKLLNELKFTKGFSDSFLASLHDGLLIINPKGKIIVVNDALSQMTGFDKDELLGVKLPFPFWPPEFHTDFKNRFKEISKDKLKREFEATYMHKNGARFPVILLVASIKNDKDESIAYLAIVQDNTKAKRDVVDVNSQNREIFSILNYRKKYMDLIIEKKFSSQLDVTLNNISDGFVSLDTNWCYTYVNKKAGEFLGRDPSSLIGKHIWTEFPNGVGLPFYNAYYKAVETQQTQCLKEYYQPFDKWFENRIYPSPEGLTIYFTDITERVKIEALLTESKKHLDSIINNIGDPLFVKDVQGRILIVNDAFCKMFSLSRTDILGKTLAEDVSPEEQEIFSRIDKQVLASGIENVNEENLTIRNNETRIISTKKTRYVDEKKTKFLIGIIRDITEQKKAESNNLMLLSLIETSDDFIGLASLEGKPIYLNTNGKKMLGLKVDVELPTHITDFFPKEHRDVIQNELVANINKNNKWHGESQFKNFKTGALISIELSGFLIRDSINDKPIALGIIAANITERKTAEINLEENKKFLLEAQKIAKIGNFSFDVKTETVQASTTFKEIIGLDLKSDLTLDIWRAVTHPDDAPSNKKIFENCLKTGEKFDLEYRVITLNNNELKWVHSLGEVVFVDGVAIDFFGTMQDITERKLAQIELNNLREQLEQENVYLRNELDLVFNYEEMVYGSEAFSNVLTELEKVAPTTATVLLLGESGTGKELLARAIHNTSLRNNKPLIKVNCSAIPRELMESELFGHKKGSFTGAFSDKIGKFELADGGTLFLDEIGELPLDMQPKILRFLQEGEIEVIGGLGLKKLDVRIIAATNRNLKEEIEKKQFREDLYFRLNVFPIEVPPLRKRKDDIPLLVEHFVDKFNKAYEKNIKYIPDDAMSQLKSYNWPGNIRELENLIERASILSNSNTLLIPGFESSTQVAKQLKNNKDTSLNTVQRNHILQVLEQCKWKISGPNGASVLLDLKPSTLRDKMAKLNIVKSLKK